MLIVVVLPTMKLLILNIPPTFLIKHIVYMNESRSYFMYLYCSVQLTCELHSRCRARIVFIFFLYSLVEFCLLNHEGTNDCVPYFILFYCVMHQTMC
jgi:hypothetical protein